MNTETKITYRNYLIKINTITKSFSVEAVTNNTKWGLGNMVVNGLKYKHNGQIVYDYPELLPKYIKNKINSLLK